MKTRPYWHFVTLGLAVLAATACFAADKDIGVGAKPIPGAEVIFDGTRQMLDAKWTYWEGPRFAAALPIKWQINRRASENQLPISKAPCLHTCGGPPQPMGNLRVGHRA